MDHHYTIIDAFSLEARVDEGRLVGGTSECIDEMAPSKMIHELGEQFHRSWHTKTIHVSTMVVRELGCKFQEGSIQPCFYLQNLFNRSFVRGVPSQKNSRCFLIKVFYGIFDLQLPDVFFIHCVDSPSHSVIRVFESSDELDDAILSNACCTFWLASLFPSELVRNTVKALLG